MHATIDLGIEVDKPTSKGNIWTKVAVEKVVSEINRRVPFKCYFMIEMAHIGRPAIEVLGAEVDDGKFKIHVETLGSREGKVAENLIREDKIKFLPMIETDKAYLAPDNKKYIQDVLRLNRLGIESNQVIREMIGR
jgi:hypothetical protein